MAWSPTTGAAPMTGFRQQGVTSVRWGSRGLVTSINGQAIASLPTSIGVVLRFNQKTQVENIKLPNGDGLTVTRVQIVDGQQWDVTVRDDENIDSRPSIGTTVVIYDAGGLISSSYLKYSATVIDSGWDTAPKQPGEMTFSVEALTLVEGTSGSA